MDNPKTQHTIIPSEWGERPMDFRQLYSAIDDTPLPPGTKYNWFVRLKARLILWLWIRRHSNVVDD